MSDKSIHQIAEELGVDTSKFRTTVEWDEQVLAPYYKAKLLEQLDKTTLPAVRAYAGRKGHNQHLKHLES